MPIFHPIARFGTLAAALLAAGAASGETVKSVGTGGLGTLTMCRNWMVYSDCRTYNHVAVPPRIAVGDSIGLDFGSNPKEYQFPVARIVRKGNRCTIYSETTGEPERLNRIVVEPCLDRTIVP